ncbi:MAG: transposase [Gammaproteobacteria bacterium]|jgi:transposase
MPKPDSASLSATQVTPDPVLEKRSHRRFPTEDKLRIIAEADQCKHGELSGLLRRERLYSSQLRTWRRQLADGGPQALSKSAPGPVSKVSAADKELGKLRRANAKLTRELEIANGCLSLQKKALEMLDKMRDGTSE